MTRIIDCPRCGTPKDAKGNLISAADEHGVCLQCRNPIIGDPVEPEGHSSGTATDITTLDHRVLTASTPVRSR